MEVKNAHCKATDGLLIRNISSTFASNVGGLALGFVSSILLNRALGPEGKGIYALLLTTSQLVILLASFGIGKSVTFFLAGREFPRRAVFANFLSLAAGACVFGLAILVFLNFLPASTEIMEDRGGILVCLFFFSLVHSLGLSALRGLKLFGVCNVLSLATSAVFIAVLFAASLHGGLNPAVAVLAKSSAFGIILIFIVVQLRQHGFALTPTIDPPLLKKMLGYGMGFFFYGLFQNLNYRFDLILVSHLTNHANAGWYSTGTGLAEIIWYFPNAIGLVLFPVAAGLEGKQSDLLVARVCRWSLFLMTVGVGVLVLLAPWIVRTLYGAQFLPTVAVIYSLSAGIITNGMFQILGIHLAARQRLKLLTLITASGFAVNLCLNYWMIPRWGIIGAGVAASISYSVSGFLTAAAFVSMTGLPWSSLFLIPRQEFAKVVQTVGNKMAHYLR